MLTCGSKEKSENNILFFFSSFNKIAINPITICIFLLCQYLFADCPISACENTISSSLEEKSDADSFRSIRSVQGDDTTKIPLEITAGSIEFAGTYNGSLYAFGINARIRLHDPLSVGFRVSLDPEYFSLFTIPYIRIGWQDVGGFEIGTLIRPDMTALMVPYWEVWKIWLGNERIFTLNASVLSNVPISSVGYYDIGFSAGIGERDNRVWLGLASLDKAKGPGIKVQLESGDKSSFLINGSYMIGQDKEKISYSVSVGWRQDF